MEEKIELLRKAFGQSWPNGGEHLFYCPKCDHHKKKLSVNIEKNVFKCWICDYSGSQISSLFKRHADSSLYHEWTSLNGFVDITKYDAIFSGPLIEENKKIDLPAGFKTLTGPINNLKIKPLNYLNSRGISKQDILRWKIGFCDYGEYAGRVIVPSFDIIGNLNYFVGRSYDGNSYKYRNPPVSKDIIFNDLNINWKDDIILVEGVFDAIKCENAIPILGSSLKERTKLFEKISLNRPSIYLAFDLDAKEKELKLAKTLKEYDLDVFSVKVSPYSDVAEMSRQEFATRKLNASFVSDIDYLKYKLNF